MKHVSRKPTAGALVLGAAIAVMSAGLAAAHEFTAAIIGGDAVAETEIAEVARGFIVATDERDGHSAETSDGHLGGLDVQIRVVPRSAAGAISALVGSPSDPAAIALVLDPGSVEAGASVIGPDTIVFGPGTLPSRDLQAASGFARRFEALFGRTPTEAAAQGYNAARRIDAAIRPLGGLAPRAGIEAALAGTAAGIDW